MNIYVVKQGDNIDSIAKKEGVLVETIIYNNQLIYPYELAIGQALLIQTDERSPARNLVTNGYAYPFISSWVLEETLPFLSKLSIFSYGFTKEGNLIVPLWSDTWMIEEASSFGVASILTLTPLGENGKFNNNLIHALVNDKKAQETLINELKVILKGKGFFGVDIDFEYILAEDRDEFTTFVANVTKQLNPLGYEVSVALAPKTTTEQLGLLYEGKDYGGLGAAANQVLLMTYEWGYTYSQPMAVAPINKVRTVVEYAITEIPRNKINLGIPNYGYDWALPYEKGVTKAQTIGNVEAVRIAIYQGVPIFYDEIAQTPYFRYTENGVAHEVWFEDVRSIKAKLDLVKEYELHGVGYWQIMQLFRANWVLLNDIFNVKKL